MEAYLYWFYHPIKLKVYVGVQYGKNCNHKNFKIKYKSSCSQNNAEFWHDMHNDELEGEVLMVITCMDRMERERLIKYYEEQLTNLFIDSIGVENVYNGYVNGKFLPNSDNSERLSEFNPMYDPEIVKKSVEHHNYKKGEEHPSYGKPREENICKQISDTLKEEYESGRIVNARKGKKNSDEMNKKHSQTAKEKGSYKGPKNGRYKFVCPLILCYRKYVLNETLEEIAKAVGFKSRSKLGMKFKEYNIPIRRKSTKKVR